MAVVQGSTSSSVIKTMYVTGEARVNFFITNLTAGDVTINLYSLGTATSNRVGPKDFILKEGKTFEVKDIVFNDAFTWQLTTTGAVDYYVWTTTGFSSHSIWPQTDITVTGGGGSDAHFQHEQAIASATWTVNHNLSKFPSVTVVTSAGDEVIGNVSYTSLNQVVLTFSAPFAGKAYFN